MSSIFDPSGGQHFKKFVPMLCSGACTYGHGVSMNVDGEVANSVTATLSAVVGVANESGVAGDVIMVQTMGYCDHVVTDGTVAASDLVLHVVNGGTVVGATEAQLSSDPTLAFAIVGKNLLAVDDGTTGACWLMCSTGS